MYEANIRLASGMSFTGVGSGGINLLCGIMYILSPCKTYIGINRVMCYYLEEVYVEGMEEASGRTVEENSENNYGFMLAFYS